MRLFATRQFKTYVVWKAGFFLNTIDKTNEINLFKIHIPAEKAVRITDDRNIGWYIEWTKLPKDMRYAKE
jgi:hypothetical protein